MTQLWAPAHLSHQDNARHHRTRRAGAHTDAPARLKEDRRVLRRPEVEQQRVAVHVVRQAGGHAERHGGAGRQVARGAAHRRASARRTPPPQLTHPMGKIGQLSMDVECDPYFILHVLFHFGTF